MLESIADLTRARPHERARLRLSSAEYRIYRDGYYMGVLMALRVAQAAIDRFRVAVRTRREQAREKRRAG